MIAFATPPTRVAHRILIADDNRNGRAVVEDLLTAAGYQVEAVGDGVETLAAIERTPPALLLLDIRMPTLDGLGVLERLQRSGRMLPVIVLTAQYDAREAAIARGAARVLIKPLTLDGVLDAVQAIVS